MACIFVIAVFLASYAGIVLIGDLECLAGTPLDSASYFLTYGLAALLKRALELGFGPDATERALLRCWSLVDSPRNPVGQIVFMCIYVGCVVAIVLEVMPKLPLLESILAVLYMSVIFLLFVVVSTSDPGFLNGSNQVQLLDLFPSDGILWKEKCCETCLLMRPARAKHHYGRCIAVFDHYCLWVGNSIGLYNMRYFLLFLIVTAWSCAHGVIIGYQVLRKDIFVSRGLRPSDYRVLYRILASQYPVLSALVAFMAVCFMAMFAFTVMHITQILHGLTTYEYIKLRTMDEEVRQKYTRRPLSWSNLDLFLRAGHYVSHSSKTE
jgi:hypothetical protein